MLLPSHLFSEKMILDPKQILDVNTGNLYKSQVLIEDGIIKEIDKDLSKKYKNLTLKDLSKLTLLPGLMDSHVHLIGNTNVKGYKSIGESSYLSTIYGVDNAK